MRDVLIVGAGQAGLQLALGLQAQGYQVTVASERSPDDMRAGPVTSTQVLFPTALALEAEQGLDMWGGQVPSMPRTGFTVPGPDGSPVVDWLGEMGGSESVDQRVKMPAWLEAFAARGGDLRLGRLDVPGIDALAPSYDLVVVTAGRGGPAALFERDADRSVFARPQRHLAAVYLHGVEPRPSDSGPSVHLNVVPGVGELFFMPALTLSGPCEIVLVEALPGGPFDVFGTGVPPATAEHWELTRRLIEAHTPWDWPRSRRAEPTDGRATLCGAITPVVRRAVAELPSGIPVLGLGDAVVTNDPVVGQGANNACWAASACLRGIVERGTLPFDEAWMRQVADAIWEGRVRHSVKVTNTLLQPPPEHVLTLLGAGNTHRAVADRFARAIDRPEDFENFLYDRDKAYAYLRGVGALGPE
jgi:NAD(P)-dependent dehydrogenase (short-subunit alcohol dehydrogenase family)